MASKLYKQIEKMVTKELHKQGVSFVSKEANAGYVAHYTDTVVTLNERNVPKNDADRSFILLHMLGVTLLKTKDSFYRSMSESYSHPTTADFLACRMIENTIGYDNYKTLPGFRGSSSFMIIEKLKRFSLEQNIKSYI